MPSSLSSSFFPSFCALQFLYCHQLVLYTTPLISFDLFFFFPPLPGHFGFPDARFIFFAVVLRQTLV